MHGEHGQRLQHDHHSREALDLSGSLSDSQGTQSESRVRSDSLSRGSEKLPEALGRKIEQASQSYVPQAFSSLVMQKRTILLEVACSPDSRLTHAVQTLAGYPEAAVRASHWNNHDLSTGAGVKLLRRTIDELKPPHVWISPECGPYSPMQNLNARTEQQRHALEQKRRDALKQYVGASCVFQYGIQQGCHVSWEWSQKCQAWRLPLMQDLIRKYQPWISVVNGCQVNLRNAQGELLHKGWKVMTTHQRLARVLDLPCRCSRHQTHAKCEGSMTHVTAYYTPEMAKRIAQAVYTELTLGMIQEELQGRSHLPESFGHGSGCVCESLKCHGCTQACGACMEGLSFRDDEQHRTPEDVFVAQQLSSEQVEDVKRKLYLLHAATGHGNTRHMIHALQKRGVSEEVLELARQIKCSICDARQKVGHRNAASLEPIPPKWATVSGDAGHWVHPVSGERVEFALLIDEGSRFRAARILCRGKHKTMTAGQFVHYLQEGWSQYFGCPQTLRLDPAGALRSNEVERHCDKYGIFLDFIPGEAHWKLGVCEQAVQGTKALMDKLAEEDPEISAEEALSTAVRTFNTREQVRGYSPVQHALGRAPDEMGRCVQSLAGEALQQILPDSGPEFEVQIQRMRAAEQAHAEWNAQQRITRALNSRGSRQVDYRPGDLVFFWRRQLTGNLSSASRQKQGAFLGPARVLAVETHGQGIEAHQSQTVWLVRGRRLLKSSVEQLRPATEREEVVESLAVCEEDKAPWTFQRLTESLGGNEFEDISAELPTDREWHRAQDPMQVEPQRRIHRKTPAAEIDQSMESQRSRPPEKRAASREAAGPRRPQPEPPIREAAWYQEVAESSKREAQGQAFWHTEQQAIEVEIDMPSSRRQWQTFTEDMQSYFVGALKKRAVEVSERRLSPEELQKFKEAKDSEVRNFIAAKAFEALPADMRPPAEVAVKMRWLLTWKLKDDGSYKAKARAIVLGYQDPEYETRATTSPVMSRQTRQLLLTMSARRRWKLQKGDVTGAFLQGRAYPQELFCIPCDEILHAMGLEPGTITKIRRGCYGLVDAPLEWYRTVSEVLEELGLVKSYSDPCCWMWKPQGVLQGLISGHVDDFLFAGDADNKAWQQILEQIRTRFKWTDWEEKKFVQCGVLVEEQADGSYHLSQSAYLEKIPEIHVNASRRKQTSEATTDYEKSQLRAALGALSWVAQQTAPHLSAEVSLQLSQVKSSTVEQILQVNKLIYQAKSRKDHRMIIHAIPEHVPIGVFTWADAAGQNRRDGSSTQGVFVGLGPLDMLQGEVGNVIPIAWHSHKIERQCRSPGAAEAIAVASGEDYMYYVRFQWSEFCQSEVTLFDIDGLVAKVPGCLVSDSRNVYDKLLPDELTIRGAEKKTDLELLSVKQAQYRTGVLLRWVHSEAQLANSLTKGQSKEIELFYNLQHKWRLVSDEQMRSARRRRKDGLEALQDAAHTNKTPHPHGFPSQNVKGHS